MAANPTTAATGGPDQWTLRAFGIVALCFAINMVDGMDVVIMSYIAPALGRDWGVAPDAISMTPAARVSRANTGGAVARSAGRISRQKRMSCPEFCLSRAFYSMGAKPETTGFGHLESNTCSYDLLRAVPALRWKKKPG